MADFSFLSDTDDSGVEDILSQALDLAVLEQVAAINCSGFSDSVLPTDLETRFRKLKSFPEAKPKLKHPPPVFNTEGKKIPTSLNQCKKTPTSPSDETEFDSQFAFNDSVKRGDGTEVNRLKVKNAKANSLSDEEISNFSLPKVKSSGRNEIELKSKTGFLSSPSNSSDFSLHAVSPPRQTCCFWCSPKGVSKKKNKENRAPDIDLETLDWGKNGELLTDLSTFSLKNQGRKLKKALKEEETISREAEKVVEWAKQASARMNVSGIHDVLSDDERSD